MRTERPEAFACLLQEFLGDRDVDQRRVDIAVTQIGREERQPILRIDAGAVPLENAVHDERVTQVVNARTNLAFRRLDPGTPQDIDKASRYGLRGVAIVPLIMPEQTRFGACGAFTLRLASR